MKIHLRIGMKKLITNKSFIEYRWNLEYWKTVTNKALRGFSYPEKVQFALQETDLTEDAALKFAPLPTLEQLLTEFTPFVEPNCTAGISGTIAQTFAVDHRLNEMQLSRWCVAIPK